MQSARINPKNPQGDYSLRPTFPCMVGSGALLALVISFVREAVKMEQIVIPTNIHMIDQMREMMNL